MCIFKLDFDGVISALVFDGHNCFKPWVLVGIFKEQVVHVSRLALQRKQSATLLIKIRFKQIDPFDIGIKYYD